MESSFGDAVAAEMDAAKRDLAKEMNRVVSPGPQTSVRVPWRRRIAYRFTTATQKARRAAARRLYDFETHEGW